MKKLILIILTILSIQGFSQIQYNTARKLVYVRTCNIAGKKPLTTDLSSNIYGYNSADSVWYSLVNGVVTPTDTYYPYSAGKKKLVGSVSEAVAYKFSTVKKMYYYLYNNVAGNKPITADFPTSIYRCVNTADSLEYDKYSGVIRTAFVRYSYTPRLAETYPTLDTRIYVSSLGNDASTNPHNPNTPYKTINKVNSISLSGGDTVMFRSGDTFYGRININNSGTYGFPIVYSSYGSGEKPIITGFKEIQSWSNQGSNIWKATVPTVNTVIKVVTINGKQYGIGRYPNTGWLTYESNVDDVSITDNQLMGYPNWKGAECVLRRIKWTLEVCQITNHSYSTLTLTFPTTIWSSTNGYGYFIQNDIRTLDTIGEWYFSRITKEISMYSVGSPPNVKISTLDTLVNVTSKNYITFYNLTFEGSNDNTIVIQSGKYITVKDCNINYAGESAITTTTSSSSAYLIAVNNTINHANCNAFQINNSTSRVWIKNNSIKNINAIKGSSASGYVGDGVMFHCPGIVEYNTFDSIGHSGIAMTTGDSMTVRYNDISHWGNSRYDCGGIYKWCKYGTVEKGNIIKQNIVHDANPIAEGVGSTTDLGIRGIYTDEYVQNLTIDGNTVSGVANEGIYTLRAKNNTIRNNTSYNNSSQIAFKYAFGSSYHITGMNIKNNKFIAKDSTQNSLNFYTTAAESDITIFGTADSNYYARPINTSTNISTTYNSSTTVNRTLAQWQTFTSQDAHSLGSPFVATEFLFEYATSVARIITLSGTWKTLANASVSGSVTLQPYTSIILIR